jgi:hypothetical protein
MSTHGLSLQWSYHYKNPTKHVSLVHVQSEQHHHHHQNVTCSHHKMKNSSLGVKQQSLSLNQSNI